LSAEPRAGAAASAAPRFLERTLNRIKRAFACAPRAALPYAAWGAAALCAVAASLVAAPGLSGVLGGGLAVVMIAVAATDARSFIIPDKLVLTGLALGLVEAAIAQRQLFAAAIFSSALRGIVLSLAFFGFRLAYRHIRGRDGLGLGDVKLAAVAGVWLGWMAVALAVDIAALSALAAVLIGALRGHKITGKTRVPFGLFFAPAIWIAWLVDAIVLRGTV
jgi:leader peptidase (prepilin peptidase) / N-methyltransferase